MASWRITVPPAVEPVTLTEGRDWLRFTADQTDDDATITRLIAVARSWVEARINRQLITATYQLSLRNFRDFRAAYQERADRSGAARYGQADQLFAALAGIALGTEAQWVIELPRAAPLGAVASVTYVDTSGVSQTLAADQYAVDAIREPATIQPAYGVAWPATRPGPAAVLVQYTAGFGAGPGDVPETIRQAVILRMTVDYQNRDVTEKELQTIKDLLGDWWLGDYPGDL